MNRIISDSVTHHKGSKAGRHDGEEWVEGAGLDGVVRKDPGGETQDLRPGDEGEEAGEDLERASSRQEEQEVQRP